MDEPLSNLDAKLRVSMRAELAKLHQELETTFIYVTHDQVEAMTMGTRIVVMNEGVVQQVADPMTIYQQPANVFVASFIGTPQINLLEASFATNEKGTCIRLGEQEITAPPHLTEKLLRQSGADHKITLGIRPEHIQLDPSDNVCSHPIADGQRAGCNHIHSVGIAQPAAGATAGVFAGRTRPRALPHHY